MTLGEYRVGISFNPSNYELVDKIKRAAADLIDLCETMREKPGSHVVTNDSSLEKGRLISVAQTHFEDAAMWAVKAATKKPL